MGKTALHLVKPLLLGFSDKQKVIPDTAQLLSFIFSFNKTMRVRAWDYMPVSVPGTKWSSLEALALWWDEVWGSVTHRRASEAREGVREVPPPMVTPQLSIQELAWEITRN